MDLTFQPFVEKAQQVMNRFCTCCLLLCSLFFLGTKHTSVARALLYILLIPTVGYVIHHVHQQRASSVRLQRTRRKIRKVIRGMQAWLVFAAKLKRIRRPHQEGEPFSQIPSTRPASTSLRRENSGQSLKEKDGSQRARRQFEFARAAIEEEYVPKPTAVCFGSFDLFQAA